MPLHLFWGPVHPQTLWRTLTLPASWPQSCPELPSPPQCPGPPDVLAASPGLLWVTDTQAGRLSSGAFCKRR